MAEFHAFPAKTDWWYKACDKGTWLCLTGLWRANPARLFTAATERSRPVWKGLSSPGDHLIFLAILAIRLSNSGGTPSSTAAL